MGFAMAVATQDDQVGQTVGTALGNRFLVMDLQIAHGSAALAAILGAGKGLLARLAPVSLPGVATLDLDDIGVADGGLEDAALFDGLASDPFGDSTAVAAAKLLSQPTRFSGAVSPAFRTSFAFGVFSHNGFLMFAQCDRWVMNQSDGVRSASRLRASLTTW